MIQPGATFKENLQQLPPIDGVQRIDLVDAKGNVVASIENQPGKQGSLAVYQYLKLLFETLDAKAADCGFGYRTSRFKREPGRYVVLDVGYQFTLGSGAQQTQSMLFNLGKPF